MKGKTFKVHVHLLHIIIKIIIKTKVHFHQVDKNTLQ